MKPDTIPIDKIAFTLKSLIQAIARRPESTPPLFILSLNLRALALMRQDREFRTIVREADRLRLDGIAPIWVVQLLTGRRAEKIGSDHLMKGLCPKAAESGWSVYLLGGKPGMAEEAGDQLRASFPSLNIVGSHHGYFDVEDEAQLIADINERAPHILLVGLGRPYQEKWIRRNKARLNVGVIINCGAYIEQTAQAGISYYPEWAYRYQVNWLYRIYREPRRLWKRYLVDGLMFVPLIAQAIGHRGYHAMRERLQRPTE